MIMINYLLHRDFGNSSRIHSTTELIVELETLQVFHDDPRSPALQIPMSDIPSPTVYK